MKLNNEKISTLVTLRMAIEDSHEPLAIGQAVSMLMPVAFQLREMHEKGNMHQQISPDKIEISGNTARLMPATGAEVDKYINGFTPPEIYRGKNVGCSSDIYSFCAVLLYTVTKRIPKNSLLREETKETIAEFLKNSGSESYSEPKSLDEGFVHILEKGMDTNVEDRCASMQELIYMLTLYNVQAPDYLKASTASQPGDPAVKTKIKKIYNAFAAAISKITSNKNRKKTLGLKVALLCIAAVLIIFTGIYYFSYRNVQALAVKGEFTAAGQHIFLPGILEHHDQKLLNYIHAGELFEKGEYKEAAGKFYGQDYLNSAEMAMEADYRYAAQIAASFKWEEAIQTYTELKDLNYKDSADLLINAQYQQAVYQLCIQREYEKAYNTFCALSQLGERRADERQKEALYYWACSLSRAGNYVDAYKKFLMIPDYSDVPQAISDLTVTMYTRAQKYYHDRQYYSAQDLFEAISTYQRSEDYLTLINVHNAGEYTLEEIDPIVDALKKICDLEDTGDILVSNDSFANKFLVGKWRTNGGSYYFELKETIDKDPDTPRFSASTDLPMNVEKYSGNYSIADGILYTNGDQTPTFRFNIVTVNSIQVYCYSNKNTYTLYRK